ncbi:MAG: bacterioferritin [Nitriliruptorales bacterium]|nr:bacterioferritin [Nitriliruptorales bacterium]
MRGSSKVIDVLNEALTAELTAVNQYFIASKMAADWGYGKLAKDFYDESIAEMRHAESLIERILFLEGTPNLQRLFTVAVGESVIEQYRLNYEMEKAAVERYRRGTSVCAAEDDPGSRAFLEEFLKDEEHHVDEAESQLANLEQLGEQLWLAKWV